MDADVIVATYDGRAAAESAARTLERDGIAAEAMQVIARPDAPPGKGDLATRGRLMALGLPEADAQILADMAEGGVALLAVTVPTEGVDLDDALARLGAGSRDPLAVFHTTRAASRG